MGRLSGFRYPDVVRRLRSFGFAFDRHGKGSHEVWRHVVSGHRVTLSHHAGDIPEGTLRSILREAGISVEDFLNA